MANTEKLAIFKMVREVKKMVQNMRYDTALPLDCRIIMEELFIELDSLEDDLILGIIEEKVSSLEKTSKRLADVSTKLKEDNDQLQVLSIKIEKVAKGIGSLVEIISKAAAFL